MLFRSAVDEKDTPVGKDAKTPPDGALGEPRKDQKADGDQVIDVQPVPNSPQFEAETFVESVQGAERELADEQKAYNKSVASARGEVKKAQSHYDNNIKRAEKDLQKLIDSYESKVASFADVVLYRDRITYDKKTMVLTADMQAYCEAWGGIRSIPIAAAPKSKALSNQGDSNVVDERELVMHIDSPSGAFAVSCNPDKGDDATRFVNKVLETASGAEQREVEKAKQVKKAKRNIEELKRDTSEIKEAKAYLADTEAQTEGVDGAQHRLTRLENSASDVEAEALADSRKRARNKKIIIWAIVIAIIVVLLIVLFSFAGH